MELLLPVLPSLVMGGMLGYMLTPHMLVMFTVISVVIIGLLVALRSGNNTEKALLFLIAICAIAANIAMWVTYYLATRQTWIGDHLHGYIFR